MTADFADQSRTAVIDRRHKSPNCSITHWAGVTLSMKNMFGVVPGSKYGWPKNILHWRGIELCIVDIRATVPIHFVIADAGWPWRATDLWRARWMPGLFPEKLNAGE